MTTPRTLTALIALAALAAPLAASDDTEQWHDARGDAVLRRTDWGNDGPVHPAGVLPDVVRVQVGPWGAPSPATDPFTGQWIDEDDAHLFRLDVVFAGLVNPPGPLPINGPWHDPHRFGPSPLFGFLEIDLDDDTDTGGELGGTATLRYLANAGRFGGAPYGLAARTAVSADDYDGDFHSTPQYERSGADFTLTFCGCYEPEVVDEQGDGDGLFEAGEAWILRGPYFERAGGYREASSAYGGASGVLGMYDPYVLVRFAHDQAADETTVSLVYALDMAGAAMLAGEPQQPMDNNVGNHTSIQEAVQDLINAANGGWVPGNAWLLVRDWEGRDSDDDLRPRQWEIRAIFGTAYTEPQDSLYAWTDVGFYEEPGDMNGDGLVGPADRSAIQAQIAALDGTARDADGVVNGSVTIVDFGRNFNLYDVNGDGVIDARDLAADCAADFNGDGWLTPADFSAFREAFLSGAAAADFNGDGGLTPADFSAFRDAFLAGCP